MRLLIFVSVMFLFSNSYANNDIYWPKYNASQNVSSLNENNYLEVYLKKWNNSKLYLLEILNIMPEDKMDFKPMEDSKSFSETVVHMVGNMVWLSSEYLGGDGFDSGYKDKTFSKKELIDLVEKAFEYSTNSVKQLNPNGLNETHEFFAGPMSTLQILELMDDHLSHHRGQLSVYLKLNSIPIPKYRGW